MDNRIVLLDNGHGENTKGKASPLWDDGTRLYEWEFNRDIVNKVARRLADIGIQFKVIVPEDNDISLQERCRRVNRFNPDEVFLISVHGNAGGGTGFEVWTSKGNTKSDKIATMWVEQMNADFPDINMRTDYSDGDPDKESNFFILKNTKCPAILTENLFMDTKTDCDMMRDQTFRNRLADSYVRFIMKVLKSKV